MLQAVENVGGTADPAARRALDDALVRPSRQFDILHVTATDLIACAGPCVIVVVDLMTLEGVDAMGRGMARLAKRFDKFCALTFVERPVMSGGRTEIREAITEVSRTYMHHLSASAVVCEGTGFQATALRSVTTAIHMASAASYPCKVFASTEPALSWLQTKWPQGVLDLPTMTATVVTLRARLREQAARSATAATLQIR
jgi:hypothetical protein